MSQAVTRLLSLRKKGRLKCQELNGGSFDFESRILTIHPPLSNLRLHKYTDKTTMLRAKFKKMGKFKNWCPNSVLRGKIEKLIKD